jgi:hypothetical protein
MSRDPRAGRALPPADSAEQNSRLRHPVEQAGKSDRQSAGLPTTLGGAVALQQ